MNVHEFAELSAGHALGALSDDDERAYLDAVAAHPEWAAIAASDDETAAALADAAAPVAPPLALRSKLLAAIAAVAVSADEVPAPEARVARDEHGAAPAVGAGDAATAVIAGGPVDLAGLAGPAGAAGLADAGAGAGVPGAGADAGVLGEGARGVGDAPTRAVPADADPTAGSNQEPGAGLEPRAVSAMDGASTDGASRDGDEVADSAVEAESSKGATPPREETGTSMLRTVFSAVDGADDASAPPASDTGSVTASPPTEVVQAIERRNWSRGLFALVASIALLVVIGWGAGSIANIWQRPPAVSTLAQIEQASDAASAQATFDGGVATVYWSPSIGKAVIVARGLPAIDADRTFELWYIRGETPIPAGTFDASGNSTTTQLTGSMQSGDTVAVTIEPSGGSPDGKPSTAPVFAIATA